MRVEKGGMDNLLINTTKSAEVGPSPSSSCLSFYLFFFIPADIDSLKSPTSRMRRCLGRSYAVAAGQRIKAAKLLVEATSSLRRASSFKLARLKAFDCKM